MLFFYCLERKELMFSADLHIHSTFSDGALPPETIADLAMERGLDAISITDHDSVGAYTDSRILFIRSLNVIPGVEISCHHKGEEIHVLGYCVDPQNRHLQTALAGIRDHRREWASGLLGIDAEMIDSGKTPMRKDVLNLLVKTGRADDYREASGMIRQAGTGFTRVTVKKAARIIEEAGGIPVLAHPGFYPWEPDTLIAMFKPRGIRGIEADYPYHLRYREQFHSRKQSEKYCERLHGLAVKYDLVTTGGSDTHGNDFFPVDTDFSCQLPCCFNP